MPIGEPVELTSSDRTLVEVDSNNLTIQANAPGMVTVSVSFRGFTSSSTVHIEASASECPHDGDVNGDGHITPADALLTFQQFLGVITPPLSQCQRDHANVMEPQTSDISPADALCIFRAFLGLPSCLRNN